MEDGADNHADNGPRKQARPTRARGKAGYRRLESVLEAANIVVQRVDTENDVGRDAFVDIVDGTDVTGGVVSVQVKSGPSYCHNGTWVVPGKPADFTLWRESSVPVFGVVHDEATDALRWVDLSEAAMLAQDRYLSMVVTGPFGMPSIRVPEANRLDLDIASFLAAADTALRRRGGMPVGALLSDDVDTIQGGIVDAFAIGRHDPAAFLLLAALLSRLPAEARRPAIGTLAMTTSHPDVYWGAHNWIPEDVKREVRRKVRWTQQDVATLLAEIDESGIERGTFGQTVFHVLELDRELEPKLFRAALDWTAPDAVRFWGAAIALYKSNDAAAMLERLFDADVALGSEEGLFPPSRSLEEIDYFESLVESIAEFGQVDLF